MIPSFSQAEDSRIALYFRYKSNCGIQMLGSSFNGLAETEIGSQGLSRSRIGEDFNCGERSFMVEDSCLVGLGSKSSDRVVGSLGSVALLEETFGVRLPLVALQGRRQKLLGWFPPTIAHAHKANHALRPVARLMRA